MEPKKERAKKLLEKYKAGTLTYEEAKELKSIVKGCFENAQEKGDHPNMTWLTLMIGVLDVMIEDLKKKSCTLYA